MEPNVFLVASAQIAVAIAGFAGVVAMFRSESPHNWSVVERFWLRLLLLNSILPLGFSIFGLFTLTVGPRSPETWRWCSSFALVCLTPYAVMIIRNLAGFAPGQLQAAGGGRITSFSLVALLLAVCILQLWNVMFSPAFWPYFGTIAALLMGAMYQFVRLVLTPRGTDGQINTTTEEED